MTNPGKTLLVGLDAACWSYLEPLLAAGELPTIERLRQQGAWGTLYSTLPALTPVAWASISTGKNPGKHGLFDMTYLRSGSYEFLPVNGSRRLGTPFWQRLSEQGVRVGLVNIPFTYPPDLINGFVVCGFGVPGSVPDLVYPREDLAWIESQFGRYEPVVDPHLLYSRRHDEIMAAERALQTRQVDIALAMAERHDVDVLVINLMVLDHLNHKMPHMAQVNEGIRQLDRDLQRLLDGFVPDHVMAISDHGSRRVKGDFLLHEWLRDHGYAATPKRPLAEQIKSLNWIVAQWSSVTPAWNGPQGRWLRRVASQLVPRLPQSLTGSFWRRIEAEIAFAERKTLFWDDPDFRQTRVFPGMSYSSLLYFNQVGREPNGILPASEREALAAEIIERLGQVSDPDSGEPLLGGVYMAEDLYTGPAKAWSPDLILDSYGANWNVQTAFRRGVFIEKVRDQYFVNNLFDFGHHSRDGIVICDGPAFGKGKLVDDGHVMDVPATLLHLYDVPIPDDFDGRSLTMLMTPEFVAQTPLREQEGDGETAVLNSDNLYSEAETEEIVSHLKALGYMD